jgi:hypothetical protein
LASTRRIATHPRALFKLASFFQTTPPHWLRSAECLRSVLRPCGQHRSAPYNGYFHASSPSSNQ